MPFGVLNDAKRMRLQSVALEEIHTNVTGHDKINYGEWERYWDEITGKELPPDKVMEARKVEVKFLMSLKKTVNFLLCVLISVSYLPANNASCI